MWARVGVWMVLCAAAMPAQAGEVRLALAAHFAAPWARISPAFTAATGHQVLVSTGASGKFYSQIKAGAPFDVLLSADAHIPAKLLQENLAVKGSAYTYAVGALVLWSSQPGLVDDQGAVLATGRFRHMALANPKLAPYGAAAEQVLRARGLAQALAPRLVTAESVGQAYQFISTGNAELGFVSLAQVMVPGRPIPGSHWRVPPALHAPLQHDAVLLNPGAQNPAAHALLAYLRSAPAQAVMVAHGYTLP
jgi:molybdate transport system substrate-binding protein